MRAIAALRAGLRLRPHRRRCDHLSSLRLYALERLELVATVTALGVAMLANLCFKLGLASVIGGRALIPCRRRHMPASVAPLGLLVNLAWVGLG